MKQFAIAVKDHTFDTCLALALSYGVGLEIQSFAFPPLLNEDDWSLIIRDYRQALSDFPHARSLHGPFMDMAPGSPDPRFREITYQRTLETLRAATELKADTVVFHANFIAAIRDDAYRDGWTDRMIDFFRPIAAYAEQLDVQIVLENMWEFDPSIIRAVLEGVASPVLNTCLDVGHAHLFSKLPFSDWLGDLREWITYLHINNNYGDLDIHHGLDDGVIDYEKIMPELLALPNHPRFVLEIEDPIDISNSLKFLELGSQTTS